MYYKLFCTLIFPLFALLLSVGIIHAEDEKGINGFVGLSERQEAALAKREFSRYALMDADCDSESEVSNNLKSHSKTFASSMRPMLVEVTECCTVGASGGDVGQCTDGSGFSAGVNSNYVRNEHYYNIFSNGISLGFFDDISLETSMLEMPCVDPGNSVGGTVFGDKNFNGVSEVDELGVEGIKVYIYECDVDGTSVVIDSTTTDANGDYTFAANAGPYRVEFIIPDSLDQYVPSFVGAENETSVQFLAGPSCDVDYAIINPAEYCNNDPLLITSCFVSGDNVAGDAILTWSSSNENSSSESPGTLNTFDLGSSANVSQVGSIWGIAFNRYDEVAYTSAVLKRHLSLIHI